MRVIYAQTSFLDQNMHLESLAQSLFFNLFLKTHFPTSPPSHILDMLWRKIIYAQRPPERIIRADATLGKKYIKVYDNIAICLALAYDDVATRASILPLDRGIPEYA